MQLIKTRMSRIKDCFMQFFQCPMAPWTEQSNNISGRGDTQSTCCQNSIENLTPRRLTLYVPSDIPNRDTALQVWWDHSNWSLKLSHPSHTCALSIGTKKWHRSSPKNTEELQKSQGGYVMKNPVLSVNTRSDFWSEKLHSQHSTQHLIIQTSLTHTTGKSCLGLKK